MRIAFCVGAYAGGGIGVVISSLLKEFESSGIKPVIFTKRILEKPLPGHEVILVNPYSPKFASALSEFDIIHVMGGSVFSLAASVSKVPKIFSYHGQTPPSLRGSIKKNAAAYAIELLYKATMNRFDVVTCVSRFAQKDVADRFNVKKSEWIPNGVQRRLFKRASGPAIDRLKNKSGPLFLGVGNLYPEKGWSQTIDYFEKYVEGEPKAKLMIAGEGIEFGMLNKKIKSKKLEKNITLLGPIPLNELYKYYNAADAYVSGSYYEGFCLPAIESLSCGTPIVVRDVGALAEHANGSGCGATFDDEKSFSKAAKIAPAMKGEKTLAKMDKYLLPFDWEKVARQYTALYDRML